MAENKDFLIKKETLKDIADSIRNVDNTLKELSPSQMSEEIRRLTAIIEQDFDANSPNAQSGKAVAEAVNIEKDRAMAAEKTEQENRDMADNKLQSQINAIITKQETQQDKVITRTLSENTVTETFDAPNAEQILILQDENNTGSIKFDKTNDEVTITSNGKLKLHNVDTPTDNLDAANKAYVDTEVNELNADLTTEIENRTKADEALQTQITDNANAIAENETNLVNETNERKAEDEKLAQSITDEQTVREAKDTELEGKINSNTTAISTETKNRTDADTNLQTQINTNKTNLIQEIADRKAADSVLEQKISDITAVQIRNKSEVIESTEANVQTTATNYIQTNYSRAPQNWDGLIITVTDKQNDKILYIYSEASNLWINSGINDVDLSNYYTKDQVYNKDEIDTRVATINQSITDEIEARKNADITLQTNIDNEKNRAIAAEQANESLITTETNERKAAIESLSNDVTSLGSGVNAISNDLNTEVERATNREDALETKINSSITALNKQTMSFDIYSNKDTFETVTVLIPLKETV